MVYFRITVSLSELPVIMFHHVPPSFFLAEHGRLDCASTPPPPARRPLSRQAIENYPPTLDTYKHRKKRRPRLLHLKSFTWSNLSPRNMPSSTATCEQQESGRYDKLYLRNNHNTLTTPIEVTRNSGVVYEGVFTPVVDKEKHGDHGATTDRYQINVTCFERSQDYRNQYQYCGTSSDEARLRV